MATRRTSPNAGATDGAAPFTQPHPLIGKSWIDDLDLLAA